MSVTVPASKGSRSLGALHALGAMALLLSMLGCSISTSLSDSVSSPFKWSSESISSSAGALKASYENDIRTYTALYVRSNSDAAGLARGLTAIGEKHGVTDWEADNTTFAGIGEGLATAKLAQPQVDVYKTTLARGDSVKTAAIQRGYEQGR